MSAQEEATERKKACMLCGNEFPGNIELCPTDGTILTPISREPRVGDIFAERYEILGIIGDGGMGKVYKARHNLMKRVVAIKMLLPHLVQNAAALKRFTQEAQAASALKHPHILYVHDFGISDQGIPFLVMDYLEGVNLSTLLQEQGSLPEARAIPIFIQACSALAHAHSKGVIHRDIKPANIMLVDYEGQHDYLQIVDFGIAKLLQPDGAEQLTHTGEVFGSPLYMSPEQCRGKELDPRSDIYSLGCVLYRVLSGRPVFGGRDAMECMYKQVNDTPSHFSEICPELNISENLEIAVFKAIAKEPEERFQTMPQFREALEAVKGVFPPVHKVFSVPPDSEKVIEYDAVTEKVKRHEDGMKQTQYAGPERSAASGANPAESSGANPAASSGANPAASSGANPAASSGANPAASSGVNPAAGSQSGGAFQAASTSSANEWNSSSTPSSGMNQTSSGASAQLRTMQSAENIVPPPELRFSKAEEPASKAETGTAGLGKNAIIAAAVIFVGIILSVAVISMSGKKDGDLPGTDTGPNTGTGPKTEASALTTQASSQVQNGDYKSAEQTLNQAKEKAGSNDSDLLKVLSAQVEVFESGDKFSSAEEALSKILEIQTRTSASKYDIARTKAQLAVDMLLGGEDPAKAQSLLADAEQTLSSGKGNEQKGLSLVYYGLSRLAMTSKDYDKAISYLQKTIDRKTKTAGDDSESLLMAMQDEAEIYLMQGKISVAEQAIAKALELAQKNYGAESSQVANVYKLMAVVDIKKKKLNQAEPLLVKSLQIKANDFGDDSLAAAEIKATLAMLYYAQGKYKAAEPLCKQSLDARSRELGADSTQAVRTRDLYNAIESKLKGKR